MITCPVCGRRNSAGIAFCVNCDAYLPWEGRTGTSPDPRPADPASARPPGARADAPRAQRQSLGIGLSESGLTIEPGSQAGLTVTARNRGTIVEDIVVEVAGVPGAWASVDTPRLQLYPGTDGQVRITFTPPRVSGVPAGPQPFQVRATSVVDPSVGAAESGVVVVSGFGGLTATLAPELARSRLRATYQVAIGNAGNVPALVRVLADDPERALAAQIAPQALTVPPGRTVRVRARLRPRRLLWFGAATQRPFVLTVQQQGGDPVPLSGSLVQLPIVPRRPLALLGATAAIATLVVTLLMLRPDPGADQPLLPPADGQVGANTSDRQEPSDDEPPEQDGQDGQDSGQEEPPEQEPPADQPADQEPPAEDEPVVRIQDQLLVVSGGMADLDDGIITEPGAVIEDFVDFGFLAETAEERFLIPVNGALLVDVDDAEPSFDLCAAAPLSDEAIPLSEMEDGSIVCARTGQGRVSVLRIDQEDEPDPSRLLFTFATFD